MSWAIGAIWGIFGTFVFFILVIAILFAIWFIQNERNPYIFRVKNWTAGRPYVEWCRGRREKNEQLGDVYCIPALKKDNRHLVPFFGSEYEYPTNKGKKKYVPLTFFKNQYAPEQYDPKEEVEIDVLEKQLKKNDRGVEYVSFERVKKKVMQYIVKPTKASTRQFNLYQDTFMVNEYKLNPSWWERNAYTIISLAVLLIIGGIAVMMLVFAYQWSSDFSTAPDWVVQVLEVGKSTLAPTAANGGTLAP